MNHIVKTIFALTAVSSISYGAVTNYVNSGAPDPALLSGTNYLGSAGENAATVSNIADLQVQNASFSGGDGVDQDSAANLTVVAGSGLSITSVASVDINNQQVESEKIQGGNGATVSITQSGIRAGVANGGYGVEFSGTTGSHMLQVTDGYIAGGDGGVAIGLSANSLEASGGSALYAESGTVNIEAGLLTGGDGGTASGAGAESLVALGGNAIDLNISTAAIGTLDSDVTAVGGNGGVANELTAELSDTTGGNGLNLNWNLGSFNPNSITVDGGVYAGGSGGTSAGIEAIADGGMGMLIAGGGTVSISNGVFSGGDGGIATGDSAQANGGNGAEVWFANTGAGGSLEITGGTFEGGAAGSANGEEGEEGYGLLLAASSSELSGITVTGRGLLVNATGLPSETLIKSGSYSQATFTSFVPSEFAAAVPMQNVFTIEDGTFGDIIVEGVAGSDGVILDGIAEDLFLQGSGENYIRLGSAFEFGDLYLGGTATNYLAISNGVASSGNVVVQGGDSTIEEWSDEHFVNTSVSDGSIRFVNQNFNLQSGSSLVLLDQNAEVNVEQSAEISGLLDVGLGTMNVSSNLTVKSGTELMTSIETDGAGVTGGMINTGSATIEDGVSWTVVNTDTNMTADHLSDGILLASATESNITHSLEYTDFTLENNPEWLLGINGVTNYNDGSRYVLEATYGQLALDKIFEDYTDMQDAMTQLAPIVSADSNLSAYVGAEWSSKEEAAIDMEQGFARTPEMANALMGLQGVFADQIRSRTRTNLRYKNFGSKTTYAPSGPRGPQEWYDNTVQWTKDVLPSWDIQKDVRKVSDNAPTLDQEDISSAVDKVYHSGTGGKGSGYRDFQIGLRERTPGVDEPIEMPETWQTWGGAYGSAISRDSTTGHAGYDATIAGGMVGMDKRFEKMLVGLGAGYARTMVDGREGNDGDADTLHASAYWAHNSESLYIDASVTYAYNDVSTEGVDTIGYEADYDAHTLGIGVGIGYGISFMKDKWLLTPEASYLGSFYSRGSYTEESSLTTPFPDKDYDSYDEWSHLTTIGATLSMIGVIESFDTELEFQPEFRAHWLHEFNADMDDDSYVMVGGTGDPIAVALQAREEDLIRLGTGIRFSEWENDTTEFSLDLDGAFGEDYHNVMVSGKILHRF
ncbi:autotransporter outer membrane beta-barrel domain-containing protein [Verrucomicrobia bacterium S94]|nr:autotransporter outer membrane beta-barrel domain-containing protein [Verrucomicrobia bacterium S94]